MRKQCHPYSTRVLPSHPIPRSFLPPVPRRRASLLLLMLQPPLPWLPLLCQRYPKLCLLERLRHPTHEYLRGPGPHKRRHQAPGERAEGNRSGGGVEAGELSARVAGGQRRTRNEAIGKGRVRSREGGQGYRVEGRRERGTSRAGEQGTPGDLWRLQALAQK